jgi:thermitase
VCAGNDSVDIDQYVSYPASFKFSNMLVVCSVDRFDSLSKFSNWGIKSVDICAVGKRVRSTSVYGKKFERMSGTSMAAPQVTNIAAKILAINPMLKVDDVISIIINSANLNSTLNSKNRSRGTLNKKRALELARNT